MFSNSKHTTFGVVIFIHPTGETHKPEYSPGFIASSGDSSHPTAEFRIICGMEDKLLYRDEVYAIQGALFDVYKTMGNMWGEEVYQQCLEKELALRKIPFEAKKELPIFYKGEKIEKKYIPDVFCFGKIILELKAVGALADEHRRQILNYLRMTKCKLGLLINFGSYPRVTIERFAL